VPEWIWKHDTLIAQIRACLCGPSWHGNAVHPCLHKCCTALAAKQPLGLKQAVVCTADEMSPALCHQSPAGEVRGWFLVLAIQICARSPGRVPAVLRRLVFVQ
jgi:hypothetical protein